MRLSRLACGSFYKEGPPVDFAGVESPSPTKSFSPAIAPPGDRSIENFLQSVLVEQNAGKTKAFADAIRHVATLEDFPVGSTGDQNCWVQPQFRQLAELGRRMNAMNPAERNREARGWRT